VDDGAVTLSNSLAMVKYASEIGVTHIVATPHFSDLFPTTSEDRDTAFKLLKKAVCEAGIDIEIIPGWEVSFTDVHIKQILNGKDFSISGSKSYILIELPNGINKSAVIEGFFSLMIEGAKIILAHPERNSLIQQKVDLIKELRFRGVMIQVDAESIVGVHGQSAKKIAFELLKRDEVDALGSDAHTLNGYKNYKNACETICNNFGQEIINKILNKEPASIAGIK
jgi:protein-tyrosine phosphatase